MIIITVTASGGSDDARAATGLCCHNMSNTHGVATLCALLVSSPAVKANLSLYLSPSIYQFLMLTFQPSISSVPLSR
jgi:hypothetical protein